MKWVLRMWILAIAFPAVGGCSFSEIETSGQRCFTPMIAYAGAENFILCNGSETIVRVEVLDDDHDLNYFISAENGRLEAVAGEKNEWRFSNKNFDGSTEFHAFVENECGMSATQFLVRNLDCEALGVVGDGNKAPRHVILFVGDGMGVNSEKGASRYITGADHGLSFHAFPYSNRVTTWDIDTYNLYAYNTDGSLYSPQTAAPTFGYDPALGGTAQVRGVASVDAYFLDKRANWPNPNNSAQEVRPGTDSGAAATAMATGQKTDRKNISWRAGDPEYGELKTIAEYAREKGKMAMGVVSTVPFSHATPAAFVAHNVDRYNYDEISFGILHDAMPDVCISGGNPLFYGSHKYISEADWQYLQNTEEWEVVTRQQGVPGGAAIWAGAEAAVASQKPLIGIFGKESFEVPVPQDTPENPLFVSKTTEDPTLAEATQAALRVLSTQEAGFFLLVEGGAVDWANHGNDYTQMVGNMRDFERAVQSAVDWVNREGDTMTMDNTLILVTADHANGYITFDEKNPLGAGDLPTMVLEGGGLQYPDGDVTYALGGHSNELVNIYAQGGGIDGGPAELFAPYEGVQYAGLPIIDNTHIFHIMMDFLGLTPDN